MRIVEVPGDPWPTYNAAAAAYGALHDAGVECQVVSHGGRSLLRLSCAPYNAPDDYARLADLLRTRPWED